MAHPSPTSTTEHGTPRVAMTIAGSDSGGGAGIQADLKTFTALGVHGTSVVTALTAQNTRAVQSIFPTPPEMIEAQFNAITDDFPVAAIKTGMLGTNEAVETVAGCLKILGARANPKRRNAKAAPRLVVDPVLVATSGDALLEDDAMETMRRRLIPLADLLTPNRPEAAALCGTPLAKTDDEAVSQATALLALGCKAVLIKGGHTDEGSDVRDILVDTAGATTFTRPRVATRNTHGTGCTLSAAITAALAGGSDMATAIATAKSFVWTAIDCAKAQKLGAGNGPLAFPTTCWPDETGG